MKPTVKIASLLLAVLMFVSVFASGCTINKEWSYKTSDKELPIGVYIYSLYSAYNQALSYAEKLDDYDPTKDSWLDMEITDDDGNKEVARKWIKNKAEETCLEFLAVDAELKKLNATPDESMVETLDKNAESNWNFGTTYTQYIGYFTPMKTTLEPYGISYDSYCMVASEFSADQETLFDKLYFEGGSKEVSKDEIEKYFVDNYVRYAYLPVPLYESKTDEDTQQTTNTAYSDDKIKKISTALDGVAKEVNAISDTSKAAEKSESLIADFITENSLTEDSLVKNTAKKDETNVGDEVDKVIAENTILGVQYIVFPYMDEASRPGIDPEQFKATVAKLGEIGVKVREAGFQLLYHNHDFEFATLPDGTVGYDYIFSNNDRANLQNEIDVCWADYAGFNPAELLTKYSGNIPVVHMKDYKLEGKLSSAPYALIGVNTDNSMKDEGGWFEYRPMGSGQMDMEKIILTAMETGVKWICIEQDEPSMGLDRLGGVAKSVEWLKSKDLM